MAQGTAVSWTEFAFYFGVPALWYLAGVLVGTVLGWHLCVRWHRRRFGEPEP